MSAAYEAMAAKAKALITNKGRQIIFKRIAETYNPVTGVRTQGVVTSQTLSAAILPASQGTVQAFDVRSMSDVMDDTNLRFAIVAAAGATFQPGPTDKAEFDGAVWDVLGCTPLNIDGTAIIFNVGMRKP